MIPTVFLEIPTTWRAQGQYLAVKENHARSSWHGGGFREVMTNLWYGQVKYGKMLPNHTTSTSFVAISIGAIIKLVIVGWSNSNLILLASKTCIIFTCPNYPYKTVGEICQTSSRSISSLRKKLWGPKWCATALLEHWSQGDHWSRKNSGMDGDDTIQVLSCLG